ncbi:MAG: GNAT family N-acetyltransferase [Bacteroidia bacterium]
MNSLIKEVIDSQSRKAFLDFPRQLYANTPEWVCPPDLEIEQIFNPKKNVFFRHGKATRWILKGKENQILGRIAAFINEKKAFQGPIKTGGIGFFECADNQDAADQLFDTAKTWLEKHGMEAMDGPVNFGENDRYWGLMVEGFEQPAFGMPFHLPYYQKLFEDYGFKVFFRQVSKELDLTEPLPERFQKIGEWVRQKEGVKFIHANHDNIPFFAEGFKTIYNDAWQFHENFTPVNDEQVKQIVKDFKPLLISCFMPMALVHDEPAAFIVCIPDLNQIFKPLQGKLNLMDKLQFLWRKRNEFVWYRKRGILTRGRVVIMGVRPRFQKYGLESGLIISSINEARELGFQKIELSWVGDFNPKMQRLLSATGARQSAVHHTYRYVFDEDISFERSGQIPMERGEKAQ